MLASERAWVAGSISGGCLERDVVQRGFFRTRTTQAVVVRHDTTADDEPAGGYGLGCDGVVDVLVERLDEQMACDPLGFIADCHAEQARGVIATVFHAEETAARVGDRLLLPERGCYRTTLGADAANVARLAARVLAAGKTVSHALEDGHLEVLFEVIEPPPHLFIFGAEHDALPVAKLARSLDWAVTVCEPHARVGTQTRFAGLAMHAAGSAAELAAAVDRTARPLVLIMFIATSSIETCSAPCWPAGRCISVCSDRHAARSACWMNCRLPACTSTPRHGSVCTRRSGSISVPRRPPRSR